MDLRLDARGVHHRRDGEDDGSRDQALGAAGDHLGDRHEPDGARSLDPILDFAGEAELLRQLHGDGLNSLEHDGETDDSWHQHRGERRLGSGDAARRVRCPVRSWGRRRGRRSTRGTAATSVRTVNSILCFHNTTRSRRMSARSETQLAAVAERPGCRSTCREVGRAERRTPQWIPTSSPTSVAQVLSGQADEDGLERGLGDGQVGERESPGLRRLDDAGHEPFRAAHLELDAAGRPVRVLGQALETAREGFSEEVRSPRRPSPSRWCRPPRSV